MVEGVRVGPHCSGVKLISFTIRHWLCTHYVPMFLKDGIFSLFWKSYQQNAKRTRNSRKKSISVFFINHKLP